MDVCAAAGLPAPAVIGLGIDLQQATVALEAVEPGYGIACYNDDIAITLLTAIGQRGWRVPDDVGLIGMDNTPLSQVTNPRLTTVGYDLAAVAQASVAAALTALGEDEAAPFTTLDLRVIPGESS